MIQQARVLAEVPLSGITARHVEDPRLSGRSAWSAAAKLPGSNTQPRPCLHQPQVLQQNAPWVRDPHDPETGSGGLLVELEEPPLGLGNCAVANPVWCSLEITLK